MKQKLTAKEEEIMQIFWKRGELCIRDLVDSMDDPKPGYTTVSRQVGFLEDKGFLTRRPIANIFLYKAAVSESEYHGITINDVVEKYFNSSYSNLVLQFVNNKKLNIEELKEIIDIIEGK
ncbi:MAG: BlaI/MecI/CopY family transcriptional regulator [Bacteroidales bacterium]|nr:BlaI/MecI/CopY family transcriptional regulator [Candidatus Egerieousia equi]